ncbi:MAG: hypothetical protein OXF23_05010 [Candidatus Dadabacteria bacterium]|nr:hypothetical protein [Candidatus Dadabacteria bacterium]
MFDATPATGETLDWGVGTEAAPHLTLKQVLALTLVSRSVLQKRMNDGLFPRPAFFAREPGKGGGKSSYWRREDIEPFIGGVLRARIGTSVRVFTDDDVVEMRRLYRDGGLACAEIAERYGVTRNPVRDAVIGDTYKTVPEPVSTPVSRRVGELNRGSKLTVEKVVEARRLYRSGRWTHLQLARRYDVHKRTIRQAIIGTTWASVPGAVTPGEKNPQGSAHPSATFTEEDIVRIRRYRAQGVTLKALAERYRTTMQTISGIWRRKTWRHVS